MSQEINLYEARLRPRHELATWRNLSVAAAALLVLVAALAAGAHYEAEHKTEAASLVTKQLADAQEKLKALGKTAAQRQVSPALVAEIETVKAALAARQEVLSVVDSSKLGTTTGYSALMSGFARLAQSDLWLTGLAIGVGSEAIEIRGRLLDPAKLPAYVQRLSSEPVFQGRRFAALEMRSVDPEDDRTALPTAGKAAAPGVQPALPRFVEFVLRSENNDGADLSSRGEGKR